MYQRTRASTILSAAALICRRAGGLCGVAVEERIAHSRASPGAPIERLRTPAWALAAVAARQQPQRLKTLWPNTRRLTRGSSTGPPGVPHERCQLGLDGSRRLPQPPVGPPSSGPGRRCASRRIDRRCRRPLQGFCSIAWRTRVCRTIHRAAPAETAQAPPTARDVNQFPGSGWRGLFEEGQGRFPSPAQVPGAPLVPVGAVRRNIRLRCRAILRQQLSPGFPAAAKQRAVRHHPGRRLQHRPSSKGYRTPPPMTGRPVRLARLGPFVNSRSRVLGRSRRIVLTKREIDEALGVVPSNAADC